MSEDGPDLQYPLDHDEYAPRENNYTSRMFIPYSTLTEAPTDEICTDDSHDTLRYPGIRYAFQPPIFHLT